MALKYRIYKTSANVSAGNIETIDDSAPANILRAVSLETAVSFNYDSTSENISIYYIGTNRPVIPAVKYSDIWDGSNVPMISLQTAVAHLNEVFTEAAGGGGGGSQVEILNSNAVNGAKVTNNALQVSLTTAKSTRVINSVLNSGASAGSSTNNAYSVNFTTLDDFVGTISGVARPAGYSISFTADEQGLIPSIPYVITSGSLLIDEIL